MNTISFIKTSRQVCNCWQTTI